MINRLKGIKTAILSRLGPNTVLEKHQGWAKLSNNVLRVHYGISVPKDCFIGVENKKMPMYTDEIIVFDDSKVHWAENNSSQPRIVLILDLERPKNVAPGKSKIAFSAELNKLIEEFS